MKRSNTNPPAPAAGSDHTGFSEKRARPSSAAESHESSGIIDVQVSLVDVVALCTAAEYLSNNRSNEKIEKLTKGTSAIKFLERNPDRLRELRTTGDLAAAMTTWEELQDQAPLHLPLQDPPSSNSSRFATVDSWNQQFKGDANKILLKTVDRYMKEKHGESAAVYARYATLVQSSGMGKSRLVDELSKHVLVIPLNLREPGTGGFPPPDVKIRLFWEKVALLTSADECSAACDAFLTSLFRVTLHKLQEIVKLEDPTSLPKRFRDYLTVGMSFESHNQNRNEFCQRVCKEVEELQEKRTAIKHPAKRITEMGSPERKAASEQPIITPQRKSAVERDPDQPIIGASPERTHWKYTVKTGEEVGLETAAEALILFLNTHCPRGDNEGAQLFIEFDEAHRLADELKEKDWTVFSELGRTLRRLVNEPLFALFLSTAGRIHLFTPSRYDDHSNRLFLLHLQLLPPITALGFDLLAKHLTANRRTLDYVTTNDWICSLGRPLFATRYDIGDREIKRDIVAFAEIKLLGQRAATKDEPDLDAQLAAISMRIPLEFNPSNFMERKREQIQVEKHMRVCLAVNPGFESAITVASSEPLLAEAARTAMQKFHVPRGLVTALKTSGLDKGDRGELIGMLILLLAQDNARAKLRANGQTLARAVLVEEFLRALIPAANIEDILIDKPNRYRRKEDRDTDLKTAFKDSKIWFNHFIKVRDFKVINRERLAGFVARGAAVLCANNHRGMDIGIPVVFSDKLCGENMALIVVQIKNDGSFSTSPVLHLFDAMDPFDLGIFDKVKDNEPLPVIRMVFALAAQQSCAKHISQPPRVQPIRNSKRPNLGAAAVEGTSSKPNALLPSAKTPKAETPSAETSKADTATSNSQITAYDFWFGRATADSYRPIDGSHEDTFNELLQLSRDVRNIFKNDDKEVEQVTRAMYPCATDNPAHWAWLNPGDEVMIGEGSVMEVDT